MSAGKCCSQQAFFRLQQRQPRAGSYSPFHLGTRLAGIRQLPLTLDVATGLSSGRENVGRNRAHHFQAKSPRSAHTVTRVSPVRHPSPSTPRVDAQAPLDSPEVLGWRELSDRTGQGPGPTPQATRFGLGDECLLC